MITEKLEGLTISYPEGQHEVTLQDAITFYDQYGLELANRAKEIDELEDGLTKELEAIRIGVDQAFSLISLFSGHTIETLHNHLSIYHAMAFSKEKLEHLLNSTDEGFKLQFTHKGETLFLQEPSLTPKSKCEFGEIIDSKVMIQNIVEEKKSRWEMLLYVAAIFLRREGEPYSEEFIFDDSGRLNIYRLLPLDIAIQIGAWYDSFNQYLYDYFPVFHDSEVKSGANMRRHMEQWGWVNFLKEVAKTKIYDIPDSGLNSIDCARRAKAFDVLVDASESKLNNEAYSLDMEAAHKKNNS